MKNDNKNVVIGVLFCASLIVLIYTMLELRHIFLVVLGASACFLIMTGILIQQVSIAFKINQKKQTMLIESRLMELQNQLVTSNEEMQNETRTNTFYTKKIGEALAGFEDELLENQRRGNALMKRVITTQAKSTKVLVKYNEINTNKVVSNVHNQYQQIEQSLDSNINSTNVELRKIGENIMMIQRIPQAAAHQEISQMVSEMPVPPAGLAEEETGQVTVEPVIQDALETYVDEMALQPEPTIVAAEPVQEETEPAPAAEAVQEKTEAEPAAEMPADANAKLDPDQIAALFAATAEPTPVSEPAQEKREPAVVAEPEPVKEETAAEMPADANAKLDPDQIAALFAAANG